MLSVQELIMSLELGLAYGIIAIGIYLTFRMINFPDMTCDGSFIFGAALSSVMIKSGYNPYLALLAAAFVGGLAGFFTGILNVRFKIDDLLSGIIVAFMLYSVNLRVMGSSPNITFMDETTMFSEKNPLATIATIVFILAAALVFMIKTDFGLGLRSVGQNRIFASICGINVDKMVVIGLIASNAMIGMGGAMLTQLNGFCDVSQGIGTLVVGLASVIIGEKILKFKNIMLDIPACIIGSVIYRIFIALAIRSDTFGLQTQDLNLITGIMIIAIMVSGRKRDVAA
jgi:putative ABC transport system permease protein